MRSDFKAGAFNGAVAAIGAGAAAFAIFALPDYRFAQLIHLSGLPAILPAAEPPLGVTARLGVMALGALAAFLAVWLLLRSFDPPAAQDYDEDDDHDDFFDGDWDTPRVRRADTHPDAPTRRPIFAAQDLGEPAGDSQADGGEAEDARDQDEIDAPEDVEEEQGPETSEAADDRIADRGPVPFRRLVELRAEADQPISTASDDACEDDFDHIELLPGEEEQNEPGFEDPVIRASEPIEPAGPQAEEENLLELRAEDQEEPGATGDLAARLPLPENDGQSISSLLNRLDVGLGNCEWPLPATPDDAPRRLGGERLSSMLEDLQKMASRSR